MTQDRRVLLAVAAALALAVSRGTAPAAGVHPEAAPAPRVVVVALGTAQDGGVPQAGCDCSRCVAARRDPARRRRVASLALQLPAPGQSGLIDAAPDLGEQLEVVHRLRPARRAAPTAIRWTACYSPTRTPGTTSDSRSSASRPSTLATCRSSPRRAWPRSCAPTAPGACWRRGATSSYARSYRA